MNILEWLSQWYLSNCNGNWEHEFGIQINTLDNPGFYIKIDLSNTIYSDLSLKEFKKNISDDDWIVCYIENKNYIGVGDPMKLNEILLFFKNVIEKYDKTITL